MTIDSLPSPIAVRQVDLSTRVEGLEDLAEYAHAYVVFRFNDAVVGTRVLAVRDGAIHRETLLGCVAGMEMAVADALRLHGRPARVRPAEMTVAVCTRDRPVQLRACLESLERLRVPPAEVLVVDNGPSDDASRQVASAFAGVRYIRCTRPGLDRARNVALREARTPIVAFVDDDAQADPGWLPALAGEFWDPLTAVVTGIALSLVLDTPAQWIFERTYTFERGFRRKEFTLQNTPVIAAGRVGAGVNFAVRRSALADIGYFDESLDGGTPTLSGGDQEFFSRTLARGYRIVYTPSAVVWHSHRESMQEAEETAFAYGTGVMAWWTRAFVREREWDLLFSGPRWFLKHHALRYLKSRLEVPGAPPLALSRAEMRGALSGFRAYLRSRYPEVA
jgi:GT2 family glycosyltransferase